jgi:hexosaminidase
MRMPLGRITDEPRFEWRGVMLDVARHFFPPDAVKRFIDNMALYKLNRLHLHLSDDQGWRIEIPSRPRLTSIGAGTQVGGGPGGYYSTAEWSDLVSYAQARFITIVPEIDMPGHTNAALASYAELNCDDTAPELFTGTDVGFSFLCTEKEETYAFVDDVVREIAAITPGPYFHLGGDEVHELTEEQYVHFMERAQEIVATHGKRVIGWDEIAEVDLELLPGSIAQVWRPQTEATSAAVADAVDGGASVILSPADHVYLDMKYDSTTVLGLAWAGYNDVRDADSWDPADLVTGVSEESILGVEAAVWSESLDKMSDVEYMIFPRFAGVAEIAWSPADARSWNSYRLRLAAHGPRWTALGINFRRVPEVPWQPLRTD